jgi:hypothetical protein
MIYIGIRVILLDKNGKLDAFLTTNFIFFYISSGLAVVSLETNGARLKLDWAYPLENISLALIYSILSMLVIEYTYLKTNKYTIPKLVNSFDEKKFTIYARGLVILSIFLSSFYILFVGLSSLFSSRAESRLNLENAIGIGNGNASIAVFYAFTKICPLCIASWIIFVKKRFNLRLNSRDYFAITLLFITINPISSARFVFLILVITLGLSFFYHSIQNYSKFISLGILVAIFIFPNLDFSRYTAGSFSLTNFDKSFNNLSKKDFDQIPMGALTLQVLNNSNAPIAKQFLGEIFFWVPRTYWQEKPLDTSKVISRVTGIKNDNLSIPLWAEGWASFRLIGIFALPWIYARFARKKKNLAEYAPSSQISLFFLSGCSFIILRGPLLQATGIILAGLFSLQVISKVEKKFIN